MELSFLDFLVIAIAWALLIMAVDCAFFSIAVTDTLDFLIIAVT